MKYWIAILALSLPVAAGAAEGTGERIKSDAKAMAHSAKEAAVDVGKQVGGGTKKAYRSAKKKVKSDVQSGTGGDGRAAARNARQMNAKQGRE